MKTILVKIGLHCNLVTSTEQTNCNQTFIENLMIFFTLTSVAYTEFPELNSVFSLSAVVMTELSLGMIELCSSSVK